MRFIYLSIFLQTCPKSWCCDTTLSTKFIYNNQKNQITKKKIPHFSFSSMTCRVPLCTKDTSRYQILPSGLREPWEVEKDMKAIEVRTCQEMRPSKWIACIFIGTHSLRHHAHVCTQWVLKSKVQVDNMLPSLSLSNE